MPKEQENPFKFGDKDERARVRWLTITVRAISASCALSRCLGSCSNIQSIQNYSGRSISKHPRVNA